MVDLGFRVDEGSKSLSYRKCSKYIFSPAGAESWWEVETCTFLFDESVF